jgi:ribonuclease Z
MTSKAQLVLVTVCSMLLAPTVLAQPVGTNDRDRFTVTLLGTGSPLLRIDRFGPSTLVEAGGQRLLFDCGRAATLRLAQLGVPLSTVQDVFLTHLHSDHINGLSDLWLTGWLSAGGGRSLPFKVQGPSGTKDMMRYLGLAHAADIKMRIADQGLPQRGVDVEATDISEGVVYDQAGVRVTAFLVDHGEALRPAFGYRIDYQGHSVVISGDTRPSENLLRHAKGTDVLVHEVMAARDEYLAASPPQQIIMAHHTSPEQAGRVFAAAKPRLAVFTHVVLSGDARVPAPTPQDLITRTRATYAGPLEVGEDLMRIDVVDAAVRRAPQGR